MIISIVSEKGGVGKTTVATNTARALADMGYKVLVIDLDQQCNASKTFGFELDGKPTSAELIYNAIAGIETNYADFVRHSENGVDYVPASLMLTEITAFIAGDSDSGYVLARAVRNEVFYNYDYIILDCRTVLDLLAANALNASDRVIIPIESGLYSYMGLFRLIEKVKSVSTTTNHNLRLMGILFNKQQRTDVAKQIASGVREKFGDYVFDTVVPFCPAQAETVVSNNKLSAEKSSFGMAFMNVAKEIVERTNN